mmetsp:Transcript_21337/g.50508  ORF Transcript_21337/g.50508 Transcript_21337/m.50508 type:complete len:413 (+) Transcript_21337:182-1420(+)
MHGSSATQSIRFELIRIDSIPLQLEFLGLFPGKVGVFPSKVSVGGRLAEDGATEVQVPDDGSGAEVKILFDNGGQVGVRLALDDGPVGVDKDREGPVDANGVGELDQGPLAEAGGHQGLGHPATGVCRGPVDLGGILSGKGSSPVGSPAPVRVDNDLAAGESGVSVGSSNDEASRRVEVVDRLFVEVFFGNDRLDDVLHEIAGDLFLGHVLRVLARNDNRVDPLGNRDTVGVELVLAGDLGLGIGPDPVAGSVLADLRDLGSELRGKHVREGHESFRLVGGVSKHDSLVTGTEVFHFCGVDGLGNVGGLFLDGHNDVAGLVVESLGGVVVANVLDGIADDLLVIDRGRSGDFSKDHDHSRLAAGLAGDARGLVSGQAGIQNGIRDLVGKLVRVTLIDGFGCEQKGGTVAHGD